MAESVDGAETVDQIRDGLMDDWKILENVFHLLRKEDTFCVDPQKWDKQKIVPFLQPDKLKVSGASDRRIGVCRCGDNQR